MTPHELLNRVRRRTLELLVHNGGLDYATAERQAAREIATIERLKPKTVSPKTTPLRDDKGADPKTSCRASSKASPSVLQRHSGSKQAALASSGKLGMNR